ncbi:MAG: DUF4870 domain-containing protein [Actinomycetota bacterium]
MTDPNAPRGEQPDPSEQSVDGFAVTDEQHAAPSAPAAPGVGQPAQSFSSPAVTPEAPGQPAFSGPSGTADWQRPGGGQPGGNPSGGASVAPPPGSGQPPQYSAPTSSAPQYGQPQQGQPPFGHGQPGQQPFGQPPYGQPQSGQPQYGQAQYGQPQPGQGQPGQPPYGGPPQYGAPGQPQYAAAAPMSPVDEKNAGMWGHISGLSTIVTGGFGGWIGPLIVYMIYKDRSAFAKQEAKEALNFGILMTIISIGILIVGTLTTIIGIGFLLLGLYWIPGLLQVIFGIIGGVRVNNGGSYRYPFNWRMVK